MLAPSGNPMTVQTFTGEPCKANAHSLTHAGFTHTEAKLKLRASWQSCSISARVASGLSRVWSMYFATSALATACCPHDRPMREAPACKAQAIECGLHSAQSAPFKSWARSALSRATIISVIRSTSFSSSAFIAFNRALICFAESANRGKQPSLLSHPRLATTAADGRLDARPANYVSIYPTPPRHDARRDAD